DFQVTGLRDDVIGDCVIRAGEHPTGTEEKAFAQRVKPLVVNAIDNDEVFLVHQAESGSDFVNTGERGNLIAERFLHHGTGERKENRGVRRLNEDIGTNAFNALAPLVHNAGCETNDHQYKNHLNGNCEDAQNGAQRARGEISGNHSERRELRIVNVAHESLLQRLYHLYFARVKSTKEKVCSVESKSAAEVKEKYFELVKFSTHILKTLCKREFAEAITRRSSTS